MALGVACTITTNLRSTVQSAWEAKVHASTLSLELEGITFLLFTLYPSIVDARPYASSIFVILSLTALRRMVAQLFKPPLYARQHLHAPFNPQFRDAIQPFALQTTSFSRLAGHATLRNLRCSAS